jgi:hypothetical protein
MKTEIRIVDVAIVSTLLLVLGLVAADKAKTKVFDFGDAATGKLPDGFVSAKSGGGREGVWVVKSDDGGPDGKPTMVLAQTDSDATDARFPMCVIEGLKAADVDVSVKFRTVSGEVDKAAGLVVRYKDAGNYYIARANAEEGNVRIYKFEGGKRSKPLAGKNLDVSADKWHTLKLSARGNKLAVGMDGEQLFEVTDDTYKEPGQVGVWTKADSVTHFDDLTVEVLDGK